MSSFASASTLSSRLAHECCFLKCVLKFHKGDYTLKKKSCHNLPLTCEAEERVWCQLFFGSAGFSPSQFFFFESTQNHRSPSLWRQKFFHRSNRATFFFNEEGTVWNTKLCQSIYRQLPSLRQIWPQRGAYLLTPILSGPCCTSFS